MPITRSFALKSLKLGVIPDDGTMSTMLVDVGEVVEDTASFVQADAEVQSARSEFHDFDVDGFAVEGGLDLVFNLPDMSTDADVLAKGGTVVNGMHGAPAQHAQIRKAVQVITKRDILFEIPCTLQTTKLNVPLSKKKGAAVYEYKMKVLQPSAPGLLPYQKGPYQKPVVSGGATQNITVNNASLVGTATAFRGTIANMLWTCTTKPAGATVVLGTPSALTTTATGLTINGAYKFQLAVTDSNGYTNVAEVIVNVTLP